MSNDFDIDAELDKLFGPWKPKPPKPKVVTDDGTNVRDVDVVVSRKDVNARERGSEEVRAVAPDPEWLTQPYRPMRHDCVTINGAEADRQYWERQASADRDRQLRRDLDPFNTGVWGSRDD